MIKLIFTGDIMVARNVGIRINNIPNNKDGILSEDIVEKLKEFDYVIGNLECPIALKAQPINSTSFKASPKSLEHLKAFDLVSLANNHIFDCGKDGAKETIEYIKKAGINYCGLLTNESPFVHQITIKNKKFGFIASAVSDCIKNEDGSSPLIINAEEKTMLTEIKKASEELDYIMVMIHGGNEMIPYPETSFRTLCKSFIDAGATAVITNHPHVLGGVEMHNGHPIVYSLGDFIFDGESNKRRRGALLSLTIKENEIQFEIIPTQINKALTVKLADNYNINKINKKWERVSHKLTLENYDKKYRKMYVTSLVAFQIDRLFFLLKNKGVLEMVKFMFLKTKLISFYAIKIIKGR
jgi:poly-gamma-glutamate capsule biosynthesis protein CapA/YwtB (metallophosphatase superfamily)